MPKAVIWSEDMDKGIINSRARRMSWDSIADVLGLARWTVIERGKLIGVIAPVRLEAIECDPDREPLAAGSLETWGAITAGTALEGVPYPAHTVERIVVVA